MKRPGREDRARRGTGADAREGRASAPVRRTLSGAERAVLRELAQQYAKLNDAARSEALLAAYLEELLSWTRDSNLVAEADLGRLASRHVLESLAGLPLIDARSPHRLADVGSGGGFPGIPIAILRPELEVHLIESRRRKGLFLQRVAQSLKLENVRVTTDRAERVQIAPAESADAATARAVAVVSELLPMLASLVRPGGVALLYKGSSYESELAKWTASGDPQWTFLAMQPLPDRHLYLLEFERTAVT